MIAKLIKFTTLEAMVEMMSSGDETEGSGIVREIIFPESALPRGKFRDKQQRFHRPLHLRRTAFRSTSSA